MSTFAMPSLETAKLVGGPAPARPVDDFPAVLDRLLDRHALSETEAQTLMDDVLDGGLGPERLAAFVTAIGARAFRVEERVGFARSMPRHAEPFDAGPAGPGPLLDT